MTIFEDKVVVVTGAGRGLGRSHAVEFARRGARVVVNDLGGAVDGTGSGPTAQSVVDEIRHFGGEALANTASVATEAGADSIVQDALDAYGTIDIVVNNAGILRDKTFANVTIENFRAVLDVHLMGAVYVTKAAWPVMAKKKLGQGGLYQFRLGNLWSLWTIQLRRSQNVADWAHECPGAGR